MKSSKPIKVQSNLKSSINYTKKEGIARSIAADLITSSIGSEVWNKHNIDVELIYKIARELKQ